MRVVKQYFMAYKGYDKKGVEVSRGNRIRNENDKDMELFMIDPFSYALKEAQKQNKEVDRIHIISLNEIWSGGAA